MRKLSKEAFVTMGVCPNMSNFSKKAFKSTALLKNCSIFAAIYLRKSGHQGVHKPEWRVYLFGGGQGEKPIQPASL